MNIKLNLKFAISFLALTFVMHEAHEIVHTSVGRIICGCWGTRDFNVWGTCDGCGENSAGSLLATLAGPVFSFMMMWVGAYLLREKNSNAQKSCGFALVFSNLPFGRILNPIFGGGDEVTVIDKFVQNWDLSQLIGIGVILLVIIYPLYKAFVTIKNKSRIGLFMLFLLLPFAIDIGVVLILMNKLLSNGLLSEYWILGSPILVTVWTVTVLSTLITTRKYILLLSD